MRSEVSRASGGPVERASMAAAALINAVGALMDDLVSASPDSKTQIAADMGVTPARISQILAGDGNVRVSTLARLAHACGSDVSITATDRHGERSVTVPRRSLRGRRGGSTASGEGPEMDVASPEAASMAAAALINAVGALMGKLVEMSSGTKQEIAANMGVTPARVSQLLAGDGNVRIASLARLADACGWDVAFTATDRATGRQVVAPRRRARGVRPGTGSPLATRTARHKATEAIRAGRKGLALVPELRQHG